MTTLLDIYNWKQAFENAIGNGARVSIHAPYTTDHLTLQVDWPNDFHYMIEFSQQMLDEMTIPDAERHLAARINYAYIKHTQRNSMSQDEFIEKYHEYSTPNGNEAKAEAARVNETGIENDEALAVEFPGMGWCLMLKSSTSWLSL